MSDKYIPFDSPNTIDAIVYFLNHTWYEDLDEFLRETVNWYALDTSEILPRVKARAFVRSIRDREVRLAVMGFLDKYATDLFCDNEEHRLFICTFGEENPHNPNEHVVSELYDTLDNNITLFRKELQFQSEMITSAGEFAGDRFKNQQKRITDLEEEIKNLKEKNIELETKIDRYEHPADYGMGLSDEFKSEEFKIIMDVLARNKVVRVFASQTPYGIRTCCYYWDKGKGLFGYFVDKVSEELDMRYSDDRINWKPFKKAFLNFDKLEKEARNTITRCKKKTQKFPDDGYLVMNAIKFARQEAKKLEKI